MVLDWPLGLSIITYEVAMIRHGDSLGLLGLLLGLLLR